jgi:hypothetical protein
MKNDSRRAGRPAIDEKDRAKNRTIKLTDSDWQNFRKLGAAKWLRQKIRECLNKH